MRLIDADELLNTIERSYLTKGEKRLFSIKVRHAPTVKTYCYYCGQTEHGKDVNNTVKVEITEHHTFAKPDDVEDLDFPNSESSEDK